MSKRSKPPRTEAQQRTRKIVAIVVSAFVVLACVIGLIIGAGLQAQNPKPDPTTPPTAGATVEPSPTQPPAPPGSFVDSSVTELGWVPEPITASIKDYGVAAARAITTYDTTLATRKQFLDYLATWHTENGRLSSAEDREQQRNAYLDELRNRVIIPDKEWTRQALDKTVVTAKAQDPVKIDYDLLGPAPGSLDKLIAGGFHTVTVDLVIKYTMQEPSTGEDLSYENRVTVSMQLQCGNSIPVEGSGQRPEDCKLIRFFPEPML